VRLIDVKVAVSIHAVTAHHEHTTAPAAALAVDRLVVC
jgi:hypothetical protein